MRAAFSTASTDASRGLGGEIAERLGVLGVVAELSLGEGGTRSRRCVGQVRWW